MSAYYEELVRVHGFCEERETHTKLSALQAERNIHHHSDYTMLHTRTNESMEKPATVGS